MSENRTGNLNSEQFQHNSKEEVDANLQLKRVADAFEELYQLFEDYAPTWYTEHHRDSVVSALGLVKKL